MDVEPTLVLLDSLLEHHVIHVFLVLPVVLVMQRL